MLRFWRVSAGKRTVPDISDKAGSNAVGDSSQHPGTRGAMADCQACNRLGVTAYMDGRRRKGAIVADFPLANLPSRQSCAFCRVLANLLRDAAGDHSGIDRCRLTLVNARQPEVHAYLNEEEDVGLRIYARKFKPLDNLENISSRLGGLEFDLGNVCKALADCLENHKECSFQHDALKRNSDTSIMLIDVQRYCLVDVAVPGDYVALSYTWGQVPTLKTLRSNIDDLKKESSFKSLEKSLPATIKDATLLVHRLGQRYLWVCRLRFLFVERQSRLIEGRLTHCASSKTTANTPKEKSTEWIKYLDRLFSPLSRYQAATRIQGYLESNQEPRLQNTRH
jgi:hypothetical protein